jgi:hypothetical protein
MYANDAHEIVQRIMERAKEQGTEIPVEDGFDLYKGLSAVRRLQMGALPGYVISHQRVHVHSDSSDN